MTSTDTTPPEPRPFTVRELGPEDAESLRAVVHAAFEEYREKEAPSGALLETAESLAEDLRSGGTRALAVECEGRLVAAAKLVRSRDRALVFSRLAVPPEERGRGWPRILLAEIGELARHEGARAYGCSVRADEHDLIRMYEHLGLEVTAHGLQQSLTGRVLEVVQMRARV